MKINQFKFMSADDSYDLSFVNWSRCYEWNYVLFQLKIDSNIKTINNTCCGPGEIHKAFADSLNLLDKNVIHTDMYIPAVDIKPFEKQDVTVSSDKTYDCVLCVSTLEELPKHLIIKALDNLFSMTNDRLIVTFDYPDVPLELIENWVGEKCKLCDNILNGSNSIYKDDGYKHLNIVLLDINK